MCHSFNTTLIPVQHLLELDNGDIILHQRLSKDVPVGRPKLAIVIKNGEKVEIFFNSTLSDINNISSSENEFFITTDYRVYGSKSTEEYNDLMKKLNRNKLPATEETNSSEESYHYLPPKGDILG